MRGSTSIEDRVLVLLRGERYRPMKDHELARVLGLEGGERAALRAALRGLERAGRVRLLRKNRWAAAAAAPDRRVAGMLSIAAASGLGFVSPDTPGAPDILIERGGLGSAMHGDRVEVELGGRGRPGDERPRGRIVRVLERRCSRVAGLLRRTPYYAYLIPSNPRLNREIRIEAFAPGLEATPEFRQVVVELGEADRADEWVAGTLVEDLGPPEAPGVDVLTVMRDHGLYEDFDERLVRQARAHTPGVRAADLAGRRDLRDAIALTIDPEDAKDHDDAVSLEAAPDGGWNAGIHIADVAHYVPPGSAIDREARHRGTSVYLVDRHIPMLPRHLTSDVCSLLPDVDRLAHTVLLRLDDQARVLGCETFPSVIRSRARLNYDQVQALLDERDGHGIPDNLRPLLHRMWAMAQHARRRRMARGALDLSMPEVKCVLGENGEPVALRRRGAVQAYQLIEEFMLLANVAVAGRLAEAEVPALYRIHEPPDDAQWEEMAVALGALGLREHPRGAEDMSRVARAAAGTPREYAVNLAILRNLKRALYSPSRVPHFGLAFDRYTHFTSPIRRYPDLVVHRMLGALEDGRRPPYDDDEAARIAAHCSLTERNADEAEEESLAVKRIAYYDAQLRRGDIGPFEAVILQVIPRGMIVELAESLQRGLVPVGSLPQDRYRAEPDAGRIVGRHARNRFQVGAVVSVELVRVDTQRRLMDFRLADEGGPRARRAGPRQRRR